MRVVTVFFILSLLVACSQQEVQTNNIHSIEEQVVFPEMVELEFGEIDLELLQPISVSKGWELETTVSLGELSHLVIYRAEDETAHGVLQYKDNQFALFEHAHGHLEEVTMINQSYSDDLNDVIIVSSIVIGNTGYYVVFDRKLEQWYSFPSWLMPTAVDLDDDGNVEIIQTIAHHNDFLDVSIIKWTNGEFQAANIKRVFYDYLNLDTTINRLSVDYRLENSEMMVTIQLIGEEMAKKTYRLEKNNLFLVGEEDEL